MRAVHVCMYTVNIHVNACSACMYVYCMCMHSICHVDISYINIYNIQCVQCMYVLYVCIYTVCACIPFVMLTYKCTVYQHQ